MSYFHIQLENRILGNKKNNDLIIFHLVGPFNECTKLLTYWPNYEEFRRLNEPYSA